MTVLNTAGLRLLALLVLHTLGAAFCHAQTPGTPAFIEEMRKQEDIYQSRGVNVPEGYVIDRSLLSYTYVLPAGFGDSLASLGPADRWLDIGAGEGRAICDYANGKYDAIHFKERERPARRAQAIAMSIEDRRTHYWHKTAARLEPDRIQYLFGKRLRQYSPDELGKFRLVTDLLGGFSYTAFLSQFVEQVLAILEIRGSFYTILQDVRAENGGNRPFYPDSPFLTEIVNADGSQASVCAWLKRINCVEISCEFKAKESPPIEVYRMHKVCDEVSVPALAPVHFRTGTPPERRFRISMPATGPDQRPPLPGEQRGK